MTSCLFRAGVLCAFLAYAAGCNLAAITIESQAQAASDADAPMQHWDPEVLEVALLNSLIAGEVYAEMVPESEIVLKSLITSYMGYSALWLADKMEKAEYEGDFDEAERLERRSGLIADRALVFAKRLMRLQDDGFDEAMSQGVTGFEKWVNEHFFTEDDAKTLLLVGTAWYITMNVSDDGLAAAVDRPFAEILVTRSIELDRDAEDARGLMMLGMVECIVPELAGGRPELGLKMLQEAAAITERKVHGILVSMAEDCAVALQDRALFRRMLREVLEAPDVHEQRMGNKFARYRAERLIAQEDELFFE